MQSGARRGADAPAKKLAAVVQSQVRAQQATFGFSKFFLCDNNRVFDVCFAERFRTLRCLSHMMKSNDRACPDSNHSWHTSHAFSTVSYLQPSIVGGFHAKEKLSSQVHEKLHHSAQLLPLASCNPQTAHAASFLNVASFSLTLSFLKSLSPSSLLLLLFHLDDGHPNFCSTLLVTAPSVLLLIQMHARDAAPVVKPLLPPHHPHSPGVELLALFRSCLERTVLGPHLNFGTVFTCVILCITANSLSPNRHDPSKFSSSLSSAASHRSNHPSSLPYQTTLSSLPFPKCALLCRTCHVQLRIPYNHHGPAWI